MRSDPAEDWQRLTRLYEEMSDGELLDLAASFGDLTETAQPVLRDEMKKRGLGDPQATSRPEALDRRPVFGRWGPAIGEQSGESEDPTVAAEGENSEERYDYTWKTLLCECEAWDEAWQLSEALKRVGIDCWIEGARAQSSWDRGRPRVVVAADQLEQAREMAARPIPQEIIDQSKEKVGDFDLPACPRCGAEDPLLESVEPSNQWLCETCGARWSESAGTTEETAGDRS